MNKLFNNAEIELTNNLSEVETGKEEIYNILRYVGADTQRDEYKGAEIIEKKEAIKWRKVTIWSFVALAVIVIAIIIEVFLRQEDAYSFQMIFSRTLVTSVITGFIAYSSKIAANHNYLYRFYRQLGLELSILTSYLDSINKEDRDNVKSVLAEKYFAQAKFLNKDQKEEFSYSSLETLFNIINKKNM